MKYILYTTKNCSNCERVKFLIKNQTLNLELKEATEKEISEFRKQRTSSFPVLTDEKLNIISYGISVGYYIVENIEKFK